MSEFTSKKFSVDTESDMLFDVLRNKIYSDPIASIIQEIISNARDAHREINKHQPIDVSIDYNFFSVRDYGIGISPDRMENIFLKYLATTKKGDDKQTGGFGLGAKTPFAYTDSFEIITIFEGKKYQYLASIGGENASGDVIQVSSDDTVQPSGTEIKVPLKRNNSDQFKSRFDVFAKYFNYPMNFSFHGKLSEFHGVTNKSHFFYQAYGIKPYLILDGIYYPIDSAILSEIVYSINNPTLSKIRQYSDVALNFDSRSLDVSVNRELLRYTPRTNEAIKNKLIELIEIETLRAAKLVDSLKEFNFVENNRRMESEGLAYYYAILPQPKYFAKSINSYRIYPDTKTIPTYAYGHNINDFDEKDKIVYLDKPSTEISPASIKKYIKLHELYSVVLTHEKVFDCDLYEKASVLFDQKKDVKANNNSKKIYFKLDRSGNAHRIAYSDIETGKTNILVPYDETYGCHHLINDNVKVYCLRDKNSVEEVLKTEFTALKIYLESLFPDKQNSYNKYMFWKQNPTNHGYNAYKKFDKIDNQILFLKAYRKRFTDSISDQIMEYNELISRTPDAWGPDVGIFNLFEMNKFPVDSNLPFLDDKQIKLLEDFAGAYMEDRVPLIKFLNYNSDNVDKIVSLL